LFLLFFALTLNAQTLPLTSGPVLPLYRALRSVGLDPQRVYKIREAAIDREDVHLFLNDGTIAFTQSIDGRVTGAYFEGEGEVLIRPPDRMERASLGLFTNLGVLETQISSAYLRFNDDTANEMQQYLRPVEDAATFVARNDALVRRLATMDAMRLAIAFTSGPVTVAPGEPTPPPEPEPMPPPEPVPFEGGPEGMADMGSPRLGRLFIASLICGGITTVGSAVNLG